MFNMQCEICQASEVRFVRDHNHSTGMFRGILCELCNSWLGVYEYNLKRPFAPNRHRGKGKYKTWVAIFGEKIKEYLAQDKGVLFKGMASFKAMMRGGHA